jgi:hypothetical protein
MAILDLPRERCPVIFIIVGLDVGILVGQPFHNRVMTILSNP